MWITISIYYEKIIIMNIYDYRKMGNFMTDIKTNDI